MHLLGAELVGQRRGAGEVGEQDRHRPPLAGGAPGAGGRERRAALRTEARARGRGARGSAGRRSPRRPSRANSATALAARAVRGMVASTLGVLASRSCARPGETNPWNLIRIMPAQGSVKPSLPLPLLAPSTLEEHAMNANDQLLRARRARGFGRRRAAAGVAQDLRARARGPTSACRCARSRRADTPASFGAEKNPPLAVYDTLGPVHRSRRATIDIRTGLPRAARRVDRRARRHGRARRPDLDVRPGAARRSRARRLALRPAPQAAPREAGRATSRRCTTRAAASSRPRWSSSRSARTCCARRCCARFPEIVRRQHAGPELRRRDSRRHHARVRARRGRARPRDHPDQHQPPGNRADDHRPQLPGEDQRQHRQLRGVARRSTRKSRR